MLGKSEVIKQILQLQKKMSNKLDQISLQQTNPSIFSLPTKRLTIVTLSAEQKSSISQFIRKKFNKIKFLRDAEWKQLGNSLIEPICVLLSLVDETDKANIVPAIQSYATACINQKRAEIMRNLKVVAICKYYNVLFLIDIIIHLQCYLQLYILKIC